MKKIGILGGTFDPPHNAHYEIARRAIVQFQLERVIFIPSGYPKSLYISFSKKNLAFDRAILSCCW